MRYAKISAEGDYMPPPPANAKAAYATMVYVRATIVEDAGWVLARATTIAVSNSNLVSPVMMLSLHVLEIFTAEHKTYTLKSGSRHEWYKVILSMRL